MFKFKDEKQRYLFKGIGIGFAVFALVALVAMSVVGIARSLNRGDEGTSQRSEGYVLELPRNYFPSDVVRRNAPLPTDTYANQAVFVAFGSSYFDYSVDPSDSNWGVAVPTNLNDAMYVAVEWVLDVSGSFVTERMPLFYQGDGVFGSYINTDIYGDIARDSVYWNIVWDYANSVYVGSSPTLVRFVDSGRVVNRDNTRNAWSALDYLVNHVFYVLGTINGQIDSEVTYSELMSYRDGYFRDGQYDLSDLHVFNVSIGNVSTSFYSLMVSDEVWGSLVGGQRPLNISGIEQSYTLFLRWLTSLFGTDYSSYPVNVDDAVVWFGSNPPIMFYDPSDRLDVSRVYSIFLNALNVFNGTDELIERIDFEFVDGRTIYRADGLVTWAGYKVLSKVSMWWRGGVNNLGYSQVVLAEMLGDSPNTYRLSLPRYYGTPYVAMLLRARIYMLMSECWWDWGYDDGSLPLFSLLMQSDYKTMLGWGVSSSTFVPLGDPVAYVPEDAWVNIFDLLKMAFKSVSDLFGIVVVGNLTFGALVFIPLVVVIVITVIRLVKR